jgi:hypothetical protein
MMRAGRRGEEVLTYESNGFACEKMRRALEESARWHATPARDLSETESHAMPGDALQCNGPRERKKKKKGR